jgi:hypothetical protein
MFNDSKYTKCYYSIINRAKSREKEQGRYYEHHHIIPKSMGGNDSSNNLVALTPREHFICHLLLLRMTAGQNRYKMTYALIRMAHRPKNNYKITARTFEQIKNLPRKHSAETKRKISAATTGEKNPCSGPCTEERRKNIKASKQIISAQTREKMSLAAKRRPKKLHSEETKEKIRQSKLGKKRQEFSDTWKKNISKALSGKARKPASEESKIKNSLSHIGKSKGPMSEEAKIKLSKSKLGKKLHIDPLSGRRFMAYPTNSSNNQEPPTDG